MVARILKSFIVVVFVMFVFSGTALAAHFEATIPQGYWLEVWMMRFHANEFIDTDGHKQRINGKSVDLTEDILFLRPIYVTKYWIFDAHIPISRQEFNNFPGHADTSRGLDDVWLNVWIRNENAEKKWRPLGINLAPGIGVKFPIGKYDKDRSVNLGDGQFDVRFDIRFSKFFFEGSPFGETGKWAIEGAVQYTHRFENQDWNIKPGNRVNWIIGPTVSIGKSLRVGWDIGGNFKERDETGSGRELHDELYRGRLGSSWGRKVSTGPTMYWVITPQIHLSAYAMVDIDARNQPKGSLYYLRWLFYWPQK